MTVPSSMLGRLRPHMPAALGVLLGLAGLAWLGLYDFVWSDYEDEAAPAFRALLEGRIGDFFALAPVYGGSLVLRAPAAAVPILWGGGEVAVYRAGSLVGLAALGVLAIWLSARLRAQGRPALVRGVAVALCAASPVALKALEIGHPEELMGGVFCVAAVLAAGGRRATWAGVLLGLAIATKAWGVLAVGPVLLALPEKRVRALLIAGAVATIVLAPLVLGQPDSFAAKSGGAARTGAIFQPWQLWWFLGEPGHVVGGHGQIKEGYRVAPALLDLAPRLLIVGLSVPLSLLVVRARRGRGARPGDALLLLALLLHLRCLLDTWNITYYALPMLLAITCWESLYRPRPPVTALLVTVAVWMSFQELPAVAEPDVLAAIYLAWALPLTGLLGLPLYAPAAGRQALARLGIGRPAATPRKRRVAPAEP